MSSLAILFVDDDEDIRHIVGLSLALDPAISARFAASGAEAIALLGWGWRPDVALLDVAMQDMDGPTLLAAMRRNPATADIPAIFLTAHSPAMSLPCFADAQGIITKPFDPLHLARDLRQVLRDRSGVPSTPPREAEDQSTGERIS